MGERKSYSKWAKNIPSWMNKGKILEVRVCLEYLMNSKSSQRVRRRLNDGKNYRTWGLRRSRARSWGLWRPKWGCFSFILIANGRLWRYIPYILKISLMLCEEWMVRHPFINSSKFAHFYFHSYESFIEINLAPGGKSRLFTLDGHLLMTSP